MLTQEEYWNDKITECEICHKKYKATELSTCDRCQKYACSQCSEAVINRDNNPFNYDFLCNECIKELENARRNAKRKV